MKHLLNKMNSGGVLILSMKWSKRLLLNNRYQLNKINLDNGAGNQALGKPV